MTSPTTPDSALALAKEAAPWTDYQQERPASEGVYEWRMPSVAVPGMIVRCFAHMRSRGAGHEQVFSPVFDHWDGYRVHVPAGLQWRATDNHRDIRWCDTVGEAPEGVVNVPCPYCKTAPTWKARWSTNGYGTVVSGDPQHLNDWRLECCAWAKTPSFKDPRELAKQRNAVLADAIEALAAENKKMREALEPFAERGKVEFTVGNYDNPDPAPDTQIFGSEVMLSVGDLRRARAALEQAP